MSQIDDLPPLREVIAEHGLRAKKELGQNFLLDLNLTARIDSTACCGGMHQRPSGDALRRAASTSFQCEDCSAGMGWAVVPLSWPVAHRTRRRRSVGRPRRQTRW